MSEGQTAPDAQAASRRHSGSPQPVLDYADPAQTVAQVRPRLPGAIKAAALVLGSFVVGYTLKAAGEDGPFPPLVIWFGGGWYCIARVSQSKASPEAKVVLAITSIAVLVVSPFLLWFQSDPPVIYDVLTRGWNHRFVTTAHRQMIVFVGLCLLVFQTTQLIDWVIRRNRRRGTLATLAAPPTDAAAPAHAELHEAGTARYPRLSILEWVEAWFSAVRWRLWVPLIVAVCLLLATVRYGVPIYRNRQLQNWLQAQAQQRQAQLLAWGLQVQSQCMEHLYSPDTVVYTDDPSAMAGLSEGSYANYHNGRTQGKMLPRPTCWQQFIQVMPRVYDVPGSTFLHLHGSNAPDGSRRLLAIGFASQAAAHLYQDGTQDRIICLYESVYVPGTATASAVNLSTTRPSIWSHPHSLSRLEFRLSDSDCITFFAGQPHPTDPSAFTIDYMVNGVRDTIDGRLTETGVQLVPRRGLAVDTSFALPVLRRSHDQ